MMKGIFCLEGLWESDLKEPSTILPLLAFLKQSSGIPYVYRDCGTAEEFKFYLKKFPQQGYSGYPILYLAFHGVPGKIVIGGGKGIGLKEIAESLAGSCKGQVILIGSCSVLDIDIRFLKRFLITTQALAVLGYRNNVHFLRSSAFEMLLVSELQENAFDGHGVKAISKKCSLLAKAFRHPDKEKDIHFRIVTKADI